MCTLVLGTRVYVFLSESYRGQGLTGLCGDFDGMARNDFCQGPDGMCIASARDFGITQKTDPGCLDMARDGSVNPCVVCTTFYLHAS